MVYIASWLAMILASFHKESYEDDTQGNHRYHQSYRRNCAQAKCVRKDCVSRVSRSAMVVAMASYLFIRKGVLALVLHFLKLVWGSSRGPREEPKEGLEGLIRPLRKGLISYKGP